MTTARYDEIADWYNERVRADELLFDLFVPDMFRLMGNIDGQHVCDLACGQGVIARQLASKGASVVGIDIAGKLLDYARREEETHPLGIVYLHDDAQTLSSVADATFDGVVCNMALVDIPNIDAILHSVHRILRDGGWFVFSITHPCFKTPAASWEQGEDGILYCKVGAYFTEGFWRSDNPRGVRGQVGAYHRMLSTYLNALADAGFWLEQAVEPRAVGTIADRLPVYTEVPLAFVARCKRI